MTIEATLALAAAFILGAMSPGPSLATVLRNSVNGGRRHGILTGLGHGFGFGIYAFLAAIGMAAAISTSDTTIQILRWGGIVLLVYLGYSFARHALFDLRVTNTSIISKRPRRISDGYLLGKYPTMQITTDRLHRI